MADLPLIMQWMAQAKQHLKDQGIDQWQDGYPNTESITQDIVAQKGFLAILQTEQAAEAFGYLCIDFDGEPAYDTLVGGEWHTGTPYAVVHRITISDTHKGHGLADRLFSLADDYCTAHQMQYFRIDTSPENLKMRHLLEKNGFTACGTVFYDSGERIAYDKTLTI